MKIIRASLVITHFVMLCGVALWSYSSYRYNSLNIGGAVGDVNLWIRLGDIGFYIGLILWAVCITASLCIAQAGKFESKPQAIYWIAFSLLSAPVVFFSLGALLHANVHVTAP